MKRLQTLYQFAQRFKKLAQVSKCKCGYENPYMDFDPNYVCSQCKTRAKMWAGDDKKKDIDEPIKSNNPVVGSYQNCWIISKIL